MARRQLLLSRGRAGGRARSRAAGAQAYCRNQLAAQPASSDKGSGSARRYATSELAVGRLGPPVGCYGLNRYNPSGLTRPFSSRSAVSQSTWSVSEYHVKPTIGTPLLRTCKTFAHSLRSHFTASSPLTPWLRFVSVCITGR